MIRTRNTDSRTANIYPPFNHSSTNTILDCSFSGLNLPAHQIQGDRVGYKQYAG